MVAWHIPRWAVPAVVCGVLAMAGADLILMRRHPVSARPSPIPEQISLQAHAEGGGVRVEWERASRPVRNADHAVLYIEDGTLQSHVDLTGRQLDGSSVMYWPESERVTFRLEVFRGTYRSGDSAAFDVPLDARRKKHGPERAIVEQARPSPFERVQPEIEVTQVRPAPAVSAPALLATTPEPAPVADVPKESRLERVLGRIPLLRRFRKHPPAEETESSR